MAATIGERMTKIETTLDYIKKSMDDNKKEHKEILKLMTKELALKADKYEVEELKKSIDRKSFTAWRWANWIPAVVLVILTIINMVN